MLDLSMFPMFPQEISDFIEKFMQETQIHLDLEETIMDLQTWEQFPAPGVPRLRGGGAPTAESSGCQLHLAWSIRSAPGWMK